MHDYAHQFVYFVYLFWGVPHFTYNLDVTTNVDAKYV